MYFPRKSAIALAVTATFAGGALTTAYAGTASSTYNTYATEAVTANSVGVVNSPGLAYQPKQVIANGTTFTIYIKLEGGAQWNSAGLTNIATSSSSGAATYGSGTSSPATLTSKSIINNSNGKPTILALTFSANQGYSQQAVFSLTKGTANLIDLSNAQVLSKSGGKVKADFALTNGPSSMSYPSNPIDTAQGTIADSQQALKTHVVSSGSFLSNNSGILPSTNETTSQINVGAKPPLSNVIAGDLTKSGYVDFGAVYITQTPGVQLNGNGSDYNYTNNPYSAKATLSGNFLTNGQEKLAFSSTDDCQSTVGSSVTPSSSSKVNLSISSSNVNPGTPYYVCMSVDHTVSNLTQLQSTQPNVKTLQLSNSSSNVVDSLSSAVALYNLTENGSSVNLINYVPAAAAPYMTYIRVANNGSVSAPVTAVLKNPNGSTLGSGKLGTLASGASQTYSAKNIENDLGVSPSANQRLQVQLTAPTTKLKAQSYLGNGNGGFTNMTSDK